MSLFGICPAWDQFYLVVCEYCKQVIKPQALQQHIGLSYHRFHYNFSINLIIFIDLFASELRHSYHKHISNKQINNSSKVGTNSTNIKIEPMIEIERSSASIANTTITENGSDINVNIERTNKRNNSLVNNSAKSDVKLELNSCIDKSVVVVDNSVDTNCINSIEVIEDNSPENKMNSKLINLLSPNISTTIEPLVPEPTGPGPGIGFTAMVSADSDAVTISVPEISSNDILDDNKDTDLISVSKPAPKKKSYKKSTNHRKLLPCKDRLYDPNKHCGVSIPDSDKPCTRSLTCKTHSLTLRRAVQGRNKNFDELLAEHREEKEAAMRAQGIEIKPTKRAIQRQQQQMKQMQMKSEQNLQLLSDKSNSQTMSRTVVFSDSNSTPNTNTNNLLTFVSSPVCSVIESVSTGTRDSQQTVDKLKQISVSSDGSIYMWSQPTPAAICNFNIRRVDHRSRLLSRGDDLTLAALKATFNSPIFVSKLANNQTKCSSNPSPMSIKSPLRNASQTFSVNKKLCTSIDSDLLDTSSNPSADPYNFADAVTTNNSSYNKPKTTINPSKKRKKSDINCTTINSSLLSNGQLFHTSNAIKTMGNTAKKKCVVKKNVNNSHSASVSATIPLTNTSAGNNAINSTNINCEQLINPSTSLISEVPHRSLNVCPIYLTTLGSHLTQYFII